MNKMILNETERKIIRNYPNGDFARYLRAKIAKKRRQKKIITILAFILLLISLFIIEYLLIIITKK